jgi:hypothetical protein
MTTLTDFQTWVTTRIRDGAGYVTSAQQQEAIAQAVLTYSKHRPLRKVGDITGTGAYEYSLPTAWCEKFSTIQQVEYPAGEQDPVYLDGNDWMIYDNGTAEKFRMKADSAGSGETIRLTYTARHAVGATSTVYTDDEKAVADLAASYLLRQLAARMAQSSDPTLTADSVDYQTRVVSYTALSDRYLRQYRAHMGLGENEPNDDTVAAVAFLDVDLGYAHGAEHLFHQRRNR